MRLAIFGAYRSFDYWNVGGTDALVRRLAHGIVSRGYKVDFVHFGSPGEFLETTREGMALRYYPTFEQALDAIRSAYDHVLTVYVPARYRLAWALFRRREERRTRFHLLVSEWSEVWARRVSGLGEARLVPYNGVLFCVSPRLYTYASRWFPRAVWLVPPVPENYFLSPDEKPNLRHLRLTYLGRVDRNKGAHIAFELLRHLAQIDRRIETRICGFPWKHRSETLDLHKELLAQSEVHYEPAEYERASLSAEERVRQLLYETDALVLPYVKLSSTIDLPLVVLEGMASLCAVITSPLGDLPAIYGTSEWMVSDFYDLGAVAGLLQRLTDRLEDERRRLFKQCQGLDFRYDRVVNRFLRAIGVL